MDHYKRNHSKNFKQFYESCGIDPEFTPGLIKRWYEIYKELDHAKNTKPIPNAIRTVREVGSRLSLENVGLLTGDSYQATQDTLRNCDLDPKTHFGFVISDSFNTKREELSKIRVGREGQVFYIGDTIYDVEDARMAGVKSVIIANKYSLHHSERLKAAKPNHLFKSINEILTLGD